jgi:hypothetical protein
VPAAGGGPCRETRQDHERPDRWYCGPPEDRRAYVADDVDGIQGGQGRVVRAERRMFPGDRVGYAGPASLKLITERKAERIALLRERWERLARIDHPNLARALEVFEGPGLFRGDRGEPPEGDDVLYVAAAWVEGRPLREAAPLDPRRACALARDVAGALAALHADRHVHRDIHPGNVILDVEGRAVLIDLGSARPDDGGATTTVAGALGYIPPEALHGTGGPAADRWGLGMLTIGALLGHPQGGLTRTALEDELGRALATTADPARAVRLLLAMADPDPARRPADPVRWAAALGSCLERAPARRTLALAALAAAAVVAAAGAGAAVRLSAGDGGGREGAASPGATAATAPCAPADPALAAAPELAAAVHNLGGGDCPIGPPSAFSGAQVQAFDDRAGQPAGVVMLTSEGRAIRLTAAMWTSYREIAGEGSPENTAAVAGFPTGIEHDDARHAVFVRLDRSGLLVGRRDDTQMFWIPDQALDLWYAHRGPTGDLGVPTSNPYPMGDGTLRLDFEHGYMTAPVDDLASGTRVVEAVVVDGDGGLLGDPPPRRRIVRQGQGMAWWVDSRGRRHWIPDGGVWACLGGDAAVAADDLPGWAVGSLPLAEPAVCP